ncbi:MAG: protein-glutamine gamma-glutamyltransferase TgpA [Methylomicrobium sp.]
MLVLNRSQALWALSASALSVLPHAGHLALPLSVWFGVVYVWRLLAVWRPAWLPGAAARLLLVVIGLSVLVGFRPETWGIAGGAAVFVAATAIKLLELNRYRDVYLLGYLGFLSIGALLLYRQDMMTAIYGVSVCWLWLSALSSVNAATLRTRAIVRQSTTVLLQALPMTVVLFLLFPRVLPPTWSWVDESKQAKTGMTDILEPGSINRLALSPERVFRVKFDGSMPPVEQLYWRGPVYSFTDGKQWRIVENRYLTDYQDAVKFSGPAYRYRVLLEPQKRNWVFALDMPAQYDESLHRNAHYQMIGHHKTGEAAEFSLVSYPQYNTGYITRVEYRQNRQLPADPSPRIIELVERLGGFAGDPERYIERVLDYFNPHQFSYTLSPPAMGEQPIETFLFEAKAGFCSHFATAFVYLMRVADVPARVVGGYQGGEFNKVGRFWEVRQANAHAWAEVWLRGKGWVRVDPTAAVLPERVERSVDVSAQVDTGTVSLSEPESGEERQQGVSVERLRQWFDTLDYQWQRWVVSYGRGDSWVRLERPDIGRLMPKLYGLLAGGGLIVLVSMRWVLRQPKTKLPVEVRLYRRFCRRLARVGVTIEPGEGALSFAARAKREKPEWSVWIDEVTEAFVQLRYGRSSDGASLRRLQDSIDKRSV